MSDINFGDISNKNNAEDDEKVIILEELDVFKTMTKNGSTKSDGNLTNESYSVLTLSTDKNLKETLDTKPTRKNLGIHSTDKKIDLIKVEINSYFSTS